MTNEERARTTHPAKLFPNRFMFHDRSDQPENIQIIDLLHDIRLILLAVCLIMVFS